MLIEEITVWEKGWLGFFFMSNDEWWKELLMMKAHPPWEAPSRVCTSAFYGCSYHYHYHVDRYFDPPLHRARTTLPIPLNATPDSAPDSDHQSIHDSFFFHEDASGQTTKPSSERNEAVQAFHANTSLPFFFSPNSSLFLFMYMFICMRVSV